ncbi:MAG: type I-E CRISPR-associated protein Cas7/Cse4/CasC [Desulfovibrionaceae bacterium]|nr:type I-E CRISPR-associated protein Cas7/Cse4/CasC [Desulfovibrionaceae bacterium]
MKPKCISASPETPLNPLEGLIIEYDILQECPMTCLNRGEDDLPKTAFIGGVTRARMSSQCIKRAVRIESRKHGAGLAIRTKKLPLLLTEACVARGADREQAGRCAEIISDNLSPNTVLCISRAEVETLADYAVSRDCSIAVDSKGKVSQTELTKMGNCLSPEKTIKEGFDMVLFGRMTAHAHHADIRGAAHFAHVISTHACNTELDYFTAMDDLETGKMCAHIGEHGFSSPLYYRYVGLNLGRLWQNLGGRDVDEAVRIFTVSLYLAVPEGRQSSMSGAFQWDYARVRIRKGQPMQVSFMTPVQCDMEGGYMKSSKKVLNAALRRKENVSGDYYGLLASYTFGEDESFTIDDLADRLADFVRARQAV